MGQGNYQAGRYRAAIPLFEEAYSLVKDPVYLFNIAQSYRKVAECVQAYDYYQRYLDEATDVTRKTRALVEGWQRELLPCVEQRKEEQEAARRAEEAERQRKAEAEERARQQQAVRKPPQLQTVDRGRTLRLAGLASAGVGVVGIVVGGVFSAKGASIKNDLARICASGCDWSDPAIRAQHDDGNSANTWAGVGWIGGGLAAAAGVTLYRVGRSRIETVEVTPTSGGATVSARISF
jgi:hypothetical protein